MIFLVEYDRELGKIVMLTAFEDSDEKRAEVSRLDLELMLAAKGIQHEVVLLEAINEEALRLTHRRYFEDLSQLTSVSAH